MAEGAVPPLCGRHAARRAGPETRDRGGNHRWAPQRMRERIGNQARNQARQFRTAANKSGVRCRCLRANPWHPTWVSTAVPLLVCHTLLTSHELKAAPAATPLGTRICLGSRARGLASALATSPRGVGPRQCVATWQQRQRAPVGQMKAAQEQSNNTMLADATSTGGKPSKRSARHSGNMHSRQSGAPARCQRGQLGTGTPKWINNAHGSQLGASPLR